jgi:hypothetical protein
LPGSNSAAGFQGAMACAAGRCFRCAAQMLAESTGLPQDSHRAATGFPPGFVRSSTVDRPQPNTPATGYPPVVHRPALPVCEPRRRSDVSFILEHNIHAVYNLFKRKMRVCSRTAARLFANGNSKEIHK